MSSYQTFKLAAIQAAPVYFDREASTEKACNLIEEAAANGATVAAFGETWLPGYPFFANHPSDSRWGSLAARYINNGVEVAGPTTDRLCETAQRASIDVVIGVVERETRTQGTVYCTLLFIGREGRILGRHRKLKPTRVERTMWGEGDGSTLQVYQRPYARISGLNCWEHNMVLPGYALMAQGTQIHVAAWPGGEGSRQRMLSQAFGSQGACYVIAAAGLGRPEDVPDEWRDLAGNWTGDSLIIDPWGNIIAGPAEGETILFAEGSTETIMMAKAVCDVAGHYSRPDVLQLHINQEPPARAVRHGRRATVAEPAELIESDGFRANGEVEPASAESPLGERRA